MKSDTLFGFLCVVLAVIAVIQVITSQPDTSKIDCYNAIGKENISREYHDDWQYHAEDKEGKLVCAHGKINKYGLSEKVKWRGFLLDVVVE